MRNKTQAAQRDLRQVPREALTRIDGAIRDLARERTVVIARVRHRRQASR